MSLLGNKNDIHIYTHSELQTLINGQLEYMKNGLNFNVIFHPLNFKKQQIIFEDEKVIVSSFPVKHSILTCGFLFREKEKLPNIKRELIEQYKIPIQKIKSIKEGADFITSEKKVIPHAELTSPPPKTRSYAFCTDTIYHEPIIDIVKNVDLLYHEATFLNDNKNMAELTLHSTAEQAATIAKKANAKKLIIGHFSNRYKNINDFSKEAGAIFPETLLAKEGKTYRIKQMR
jgi:ribonuclease Z